MTTSSNRVVSLYIHFPFCIKKCAYCAFFSEPCKDEELKDEYEKAVMKRIRSLPELSIKTVYFGGGTPTVMETRRLNAILGSVFEHCDVQSGAEITLEANPGTVDAEDLRELSAGGFNRLSLGMQSANDKTLKMLGRIHDNAQFLECCSNAEKYFDNISVDAIFALPGDDFKNTIRQIEFISPAHVSAYSLMLEEGTPLYANKEKYVFPSEAEEESQYEALCDSMRLHGYRHYEISSFAMPGKESAHNSVYWRRGEYIGIGPAAHSFYMGRRFSVPANTREFIKRSGSLFLTDTDYQATVPLNAEETEEERIMLGLRLADGVRLSGEKLDIAAKFAANGYGSIYGDIFALNEKGFRVSNAIISELI